MGVGPEWLEPGDEADVDIVTEHGTAQITTVHSPPHPDERDRGRDVVAPVTVGGRPLEEGTATWAGDDSIPAPGQIRTAHVAFTSHRAREADRGLTDKIRPVVVVSVDGDFAEIRPIYSRGTSAHRTGRATNLDDWKLAGLRKASVVDLDSRTVTSESLGPVIGHLTDRDLGRVLGR